MFTSILINASNIYDKTQYIWKKTIVQHRINQLFIIIFIISAIGISINNANIFHFMPYSQFYISPFHAISLALTLILIQEAVNLIFALAGSISRAVCKQLEIMALVMIRDCFSDIGELENGNITIDDYSFYVKIAITAVSGILIFSFREIFIRMHISRGYKNMNTYINAKKAISLFLLFFFAGAGFFDIYNILFLKISSDFFRIFYTALIFADILIVLVSQFYMNSFHDTFRYSGYAVSTLMMRIALGSSHHIGAIISVFACIFLLSLTWVTQRWPSTDNQYK